MKTTNPSSRITISQNGNQILSCKVYKEPNYILSMSNEEILELISGLDYMGNLPLLNFSFSCTYISIILLLELFPHLDNYKD